MRIKQRPASLAVIVATLAVLLALVSFQPAGDSASLTARPDGASFIVRASDATSAAAAVRAVGGRVTHELGLIHSVAAELTSEQVRTLENDRSVHRIYGNRRAEATGKPGGKGGGSSGGGGGGGASPVCAASSESLLSFGDIYFDWTVENKGNVTLTVQSMTLRWADQVGRLQKIKLGRREIFDHERLPPTSIDSWLGDVSYRQIPAGRSGKFKFVFPDALSRRQSDYRVEIRFAEGCGVSYIPGANGAQSFPDGYVPDTFVPRRVNAPAVWNQGVTGRGVTIAVIDTQVKHTTPGLKENTSGVARALASYDAITNSLCDLGSGMTCSSNSGDAFGHGTHVTGIAANSLLTDYGDYAGVAPNADLVLVRALGDNGSGTYADVIRGIQWVVDNRSRYGIRVLNLSLSAPPQSYYWDDPLNQAVMAAWRAGIVVVASAGNTGPEAMTVGVPGNVPYVVTVGALSDQYSHDALGDDFLTSFSAAGPTFEGFVKPELVAPGGHVISTMQSSTYLATAHSEYRFGDKYFQMSGTSQATAAVSGVAALIFEHSPWLGPDDVKCRLMAAGQPAVRGNGDRAYSIFQQGAGMVDAAEAVFGLELGCANRGLDLDLDLFGGVHFGGRANMDQNGDFYIMCPLGQSCGDHAWDGSYSRGDGFMWSDALLWNDAMLWSDAMLWNDAYLWTDSLLWGDSMLWADTATLTMSANPWVEQE